MLKQVTGYSVFVNGGKKIIPSLIDRIQNRNGKTIWRHDERACEDCDHSTWNGQSEPLLADTREQVLDPQTAYQVVSLLEGVVLRGTGRSVLAVGKPLAGKTGTSNDAKDVWFVGFSPDLVCGVYVGFDNPRTLGGSEQGATVAAPIFRDFMIGALSGQVGLPFRVAPGVEIVSVDYHSGALSNGPGSIAEVFKPNTAPGEPDAPNIELGDGTGAFSDPSMSGTSVPRHWPITCCNWRRPWGMTIWG